MGNYTAALICWLIPFIALSQPSWEAGIFIGGTGYQGDINPEDYPLPEAIDLVYGVHARHNISYTWALRGALLYGTWKGADSYATDPRILRRNFQFENNITQASVLLEWDPFGKSRFPNGPFRLRPRITPFSFIGIGAAQYSIGNNLDPNLTGESPIIVEPEEIREDLRALEDPSIKWTVPAGLGLKIDLSRRTTIALEGALHYGFNDLVDGISASGNPDTRDWYAHAGMSFTVRLGAKDSDGDGFVDKEDACPLTVGVASAKGCPDQDGDGVDDGEDVCPTIAGLPAFAGCPDTDKDGIMDIIDNCPLEYGYEETEGCPDRDHDCITDSLDVCPDIQGLVIYQGCADSDGDGIPDPDDLCPTERGLAEHQGCPLLDTDCDGIVDNIDLCPEIPDTIGFSGCPDRDEDGVLDSLDRCPDIFGLTETEGCPEITDDDQEILEMAQREVQFETGSSNLTDPSKKVLDQIVELMNRYPDFVLAMKGYTDNVGKAASNQLLSERRAKACYDFLESKGINTERMKYEGLGEADPIGNNRTYAGRKKNRRVEFELFMPDGEIEEIPENK